LGFTLGDFFTNSSGHPDPGGDLTIVRYNASAVKIYNGNSSLVCFEKNNYNKNAVAYVLQRWRYM
jgi:hypothetical protein